MVEMNNYFIICIFTLLITYTASFPPQEIDLLKSNMLWPDQESYFINMDPLPSFNLNTERKRPTGEKIGKSWREDDSSHKNTSLNSFKNSRADNNDEVNYNMKLPWDLGMPIEKAPDNNAKSKYNTVLNPVTQANQENVEVQNDLSNIDVNNIKSENLDYGQQELIRDKLFLLIKESKRKADLKIATVKAVHEEYKLQKLYKIGYIVSFINKTHDSLTDLYNFIQRDIKNWGVLKVLNSYEQMKKANDFLTETMKILNSITAFKRTSKKSNEPRISWSYYDE